MIPIPQELKGQEVKSFIDLMLPLFNKRRKECVYDVAFLDGSIEILDFYSQPFSPYMITEYFEGFVQTPNHNKFGDDFCDIEFNFNEDTSEYFIYIYEIELHRRVLFSTFQPLTLDMLISNLLQAGIKLSFKS